MTFRTRKCSENKEKRGIDSSLFCLDHVLGFSPRRKKLNIYFIKGAKILSLIKLIEKSLIFLTYVFFSLNLNH